MQPKLDKTPTATPAGTDVWKSDRSTWEYIAIPDENALGYPHDSIGIFGPGQAHVFVAGKTYLVPPEIAATVRERLRVYTRATVRTIQPRRDFAAEGAVSVGTSGPKGSFVDASQVQTAE